ncbi:hypothetical protein [Desulfovibrio gilichinskyi]|uniref:Virus attachment protein p12 family protein n=1 Tax=Desulfovibrio gilichinskyi TaxID=1519643 RepID=A0A1X7CS77_9BACT|nr:hypothetical protein [Desulfovibrio gilichinskyi]SMF02092.1 hypothetical protein SAMN06295933_1180 [Desulfovibrio gilichinskyi]
MQDVIVFILIGIAAIYLGYKWLRKGTSGCGCGCSCGSTKKSTREDCGISCDSSRADFKKNK